MSKRLVSACLVAAFGAGYPLAASAQPKPETLVKYRQAAMSLQWKYFGPLKAMAQGKVPYDASVVARNTALLEALSKMPWSDFDPSTRNAKSPVLPAVFTEVAKFKQEQERLQSEVGKLVALGKGGDEASVKAQILAVDKVCGDCHETFREPF